MQAAIRAIGMIVQRLEQIRDELEVLEAFDVPSRQGRAGLGSGRSRC